jgi:hypothetical protein
VTEKYKSFNQILPLSDIFELKSCILKKYRNWQARPIRNVLTKLTNLFPGFLRYTFETYMYVQLNSPCRSVLRVLSNFLGYGFGITKKQYFDFILGVSIKMYLLPGFESYTFETNMNVQLSLREYPHEKTRGLWI